MSKLRRVRPSPLAILHQLIYCFIIKNCQSSKEKNAPVIMSGDRKHFVFINFYRRKELI